MTDVSSLQRVTGAGTAAAVAGRGQRVVLIEMRSLFAEAHKAGLRDVQLLNADPVREILPAATGPFIGAIYSPVPTEKGTAHFVERRGGPARSSTTESRSAACATGWAHSALTRPRPGCAPTRPCPR
ncbi:MAG TPA: hypothetical protein VFY56_13435 [Propionibacteriaceae bacterium]|nr:hypothetical protein [Propionibacteriaceae bacterium]